MGFNPMLPLRATQAVFTIIVLGLTGYVANWWQGYWHDMAPSEINFLIFASTWSIVSLAYLVIVPWKMANSVAANRFALVTVEALTMIFWFAGFIALAVFLSNRVCFGHVCNIAKAATVFGSLEWLAFAITTVMATMHAMRDRGYMGHSRGMRTQPPMETKTAAV